MIGIIGAMSVEVEDLQKIITDKKEKTISGIKFCYGKISKKDVVVACCGVGKVFAAICTEAMILEFNPDVIINTGVAGGLKKEMKIADIVISSDVVQHDMDTSPLGDPVGMISGINIVNIPASEKYGKILNECVSECNIDCFFGTIASGDQFVEKKEKKEELKEKFNAICCEMEGASIGHVCFVNDVPFVVLRSISDGLNDGGMDFTEFCNVAAKNSVAVTKKFIEKF